MVDERLDFPDAVVEKLLCSHCNAYISCGPVKIERGGQSICGRCSSSSDSDRLVRNVLYETAMGDFTFPCRYKAQGCTERLPFGSIQHEDVCPYRTFSCPSLPHGHCSQNVSVDAIGKHFQDAHPKLIIKDGSFRLDVRSDTQNNLLMIQGSSMAVVQYAYNASDCTLKICVSYIMSEKENTNYELEFITMSRPVTRIKLDKQVSYPYRTHILVEENAATFTISNYFPFVNKNNYIVIAVSLIFDPFNTTNGHSKNYLSTKCSSKHEHNALSFWRTLDDLRCKYCLCLLMPPLYYSDYYKYYVCNVCISKDKYASEKIVEVESHPCRWRGCGFIGNRSNIQDHTRECQYRSLPCPVPNCEKGHFTPLTLMAHMQQHGTYCPNPKKIVIQVFYNGPSDADVTQRYFTFFQDKLVVFTCCIRKKYFWNLSGNTENMNIAVYFEHDHCRFPSKTYTYSGQTSIYYKDIDPDHYFPCCFKSCRHITAILEIKSNETI